MDTNREDEILSEHGIALDDLLEQNGYIVELIGSDSTGGQISNVYLRDNSQMDRQGEYLYTLTMSRTEGV